jgi:hypothetical protein
LIHLIYRTTFEPLKAFLRDLHMLFGRAKEDFLPYYSKIQVRNLLPINLIMRRHQCKISYIEMRIHFRRSELREIMAVKVNEAGGAVRYDR